MNGYGGISTVLLLLIAAFAGLAVKADDDCGKAVSVVFAVFWLLMYIAVVVSEFLSYHAGMIIGVVSFIGCMVGLIFFDIKYS